MQKLATIEEAREKCYSDPIVLMITKNIKNKINLMPNVSFSMDTELPSVFHILIDKNSYTLELIRQSKEFVIAYPASGMAKETLYVGTTHGHNEDKGTKSGLIFAPAEKVNVPILADAVVNFECKLLEIISNDNNISSKKDFNGMFQNDKFCIAIGVVIASHINKDKSVGHISNTMKYSLLNIYECIKDNENIKKRQHYVWQKYLSRWTHDDQHVWCFDKKNNKSYHTSTKSTACESLFYKIPELNDIEISCLKEFIDRNPAQQIKEEIGLFLSISQETIGLLNDLSLSNTFPNAKQLVKKTIANLEENYLANIENNFMKYLDSCYNLDLSFTAKYDLRWEFASCVLIQYMRTKKIKENIDAKMTIGKDDIIRDFGEKYKNVDFTKFFTYIKYLLAYQLSYTFASETHKYSLYLLLNKTDIGFITSDQPLFNINYALTHDDFENKDFDIFYPISPNIAIRLKTDETMKTYCIKEIVDESEITMLNQLMFQEAYHFVYSHIEHKNRRTDREG